jgi:MFS family permease
VTTGTTVDPAAPAAEPPSGRPRWLTRNLAVLCGVSLLQDAASELLYPIMPIFLTTVLGAPVAVVGAVEGFAEAVASGMKIMSGRIGDRFRRKPLVAGGYGLAALGKTVIAAATVWPMVLAGRAIDRVGKGIRGAPRDALLVEGIPIEARGRAFGLHRAADTTGAVIGPLIGLAAYEALDHQIRPLLVIAVIPAVLSVALVAFVHEGPHTAPPRPAGATGAPHMAPLPRAFWRVLMVILAFSVVNFPDALLLLRVKQLGFSVAGVILVYVAYNAAYAVLSYPAGALSDRMSPARIYGFGLCCFAACYLGLGLTTSGPWVWPLLVVYGGFTAATDGVGKAWISRLVPQRDQARAQGLFQGLSGGAILVAGVWAGLVWHGTGRLPLVLSGAVAAVVAVVMITAGDALSAGTPKRIAAI